MPAKKRKNDKKKQKPAADKKRIIKRILITLILIAIVTMAACDWYVHRPREWREYYNVKMGTHLSSFVEYIGDETACITDALGISGHDVTFPLESFGGGTSISYAGYPKPLTPVTKNIKILAKKGFAVGYSTNLRNPLWVAYRLHKVKSLYSEPRPSSFKPDPDTGILVSHDDYTGSGYDRGHMAPNSAISSRFGRTAQLETFKTSNITPQMPSLNRSTWRFLESRIGRGYAQWNDVAWIITGPIFPKSPRRLKSGVAIPSSFFKIVVTEVDSNIRVMAFIMPQETPSGRRPRRYLVSVDEIEEKTGLNLLESLPDDLENKVETGIATRLWPVGLQGIKDLLYENFVLRW